MLAHSLANCNTVLASTTGKDFLPGRRIRRIPVGVIIRVVTAQAPTDAVLSHDQVIHSRDVLRLSGGCLELSNRDTAQSLFVKTPFDEFGLDYFVMLIQE